VGGIIKTLNRVLVWATYRIGHNINAYVYNTAV